MKIFRNICLALALIVGIGSASQPAFAVQVLLNNTYSKLTASVSAVATTITVTPGDGAKFALATGGNTIRATLVKISGFKEIAWEIVDVTARSTDTLTITRARESTTALTFAVGDLIDVRFTAGMTPGAIGAAAKADNLSVFAATTSAQLAGVLSDESGTGVFCMTTSCVMTTPNIGVASATSINKVAITAPATAATLTIPDGVTLTGPATSGTAMTLGNIETVTGAKTYGSAGAVGKFKLAGTTSGTTILDATAVASGTLTLPAATDTLVGKATTDILTNKTYDTAGSGNVFKVGGVDISTAWAAWTPTVTAASGSFISASGAGRYKQIGKIVFYQLTITITTVGTATVGTDFTLPVTAQGTDNAYIGRERAATGAQLIGWHTATTTVRVQKYDGTFVGGNGYVLIMSGSYEAA